MLGKHSFTHPMHQRKNGIQNKCQFRNTKLKIVQKKKKTNNANLMSQNHHQILENDRLPLGREREREMEKGKKIQRNKEQINNKK